MHGVCVWMRSVLTFVQEDSCVWLAVLFRRVMCMCVCVCTSTYTHTCVCVCGCANEYVDVSCMCLISLQHVIVCAFECLCIWLVAMGFARVHILLVSSCIICSFFTCVCVLAMSKRVFLGGLRKSVGCSGHHLGQLPLHQVLCLRRQQGVLGNCRHRHGPDTWGVCNSGVVFLHQCVLCSCVLFLTECLRSRGRVQI